jgi:hypothetical protein
LLDLAQAPDTVGVVTADLLHGRPAPDSAGRFSAR